MPVRNPAAAGTPSGRSSSTTRTPAERRTTGSGHSRRPPRPLRSLVVTVKLSLAQNPAADALLSDSPLALLIGMVLDQQIPLEWAFTGPLTLRQRLGRDLDAADLAERDPEELAALFAQPPALHRFPGSMSRRVQQLCRVIVDDYGGDPIAIWSDVKDAVE